KEGKQRREVCAKQSERRGDDVRPAGCSHPSTRVSPTDQTAGVERTPLTRGPSSALCTA
ncbi:hypothetical protein KUCAC02_036958, partial [Chaenocephalus aceratus]